MTYRTTTDFPDVNELMHALLDEMLRIIGEAQLVGLYLTGSLALGDFRPECSDVDFIVVTKGPLEDGVIAQLGPMHQEFRKSGRPYTDDIEGEYIPQQVIRRFDPHDCTYPHLGVDGHFGVEGHASNEVVQWAVLREHGVVLYGPPPDTIIDPIGPEHIQAAVRGFLREWWVPQVQCPASPTRRGVSGLHDPHDGPNPLYAGVRPDRVKTRGRRLGEYPIPPVRRRHCLSPELAQGRRVSRL